MEKRNTAKEKRKNNKGYPYRNKGSKQIRIKMENKK